MFGKSTEKRVAREADRIVSLKEDMDAISWDRVLEIGKLLQEGIEEADRVALARELVSIAQSNRTLYTRLGVESAPPRVMASGIEVMEGGLAEAAIEERNERALPSGGKPRLVVPAVKRRPAIDAPSVDEPSEIDFQAAEVQVECELVAKNDPDEDDFVEAAQAATTDEEAVAIPAPQVEEPAMPEAGDEPVVSAERVAPAPEAEAEPKPELPPDTEPVPADDSAGEPAPAPESEPALEPVPESVPESRPTPEPAPALHDEPAAKDASRPSKKHRFARFRNLYESRDGGLCVFEDEHGHLVAVDSSKLA